MNRTKSTKTFKPLNRHLLIEKQEKEILSDHQKLKKIEVEIADELGNVTTK